MHKPFLATLLVFDIQHDPSYDMPGCKLDEQCLPPGLRSTASLAVSGHLGMRRRCRQDRQAGRCPPYFGRSVVQRMGPTSPRGVRVGAGVQWAAVTGIQLHVLCR